MLGKSKQTNNMAVCRRMVHFSKNKHIYFHRLSVFYSTNSSLKEATEQKEIVVPYRIERAPTDILKALASTIKKDHTAAHYKYEDDPYFMPISNITKRSYALSKESGRKAARYFLENYPDIFKCNQSVPFIKAFDPPITYTEDDNVSEKILEECITLHDVKNSIDVFNILQKKNISVSQKVKQDLLDLLCFYNSTPPPPDDYYEERFFQRIEESPGIKWDSKGIAEQLFENIEKDGKAYSSMIAGLCKYGDPERALLLHHEMKSKDLKGTLQAYNYLIAECPLIHEDTYKYWEQAMHFLHHMKLDGIKPDLYTMNSLLKILARVPKWRQGRQHALNVMAEMKRIKIEPSLGSYYYLLKSYSADPSHGSILYEIMNYVEDIEFDIQHPSDVDFFTAAMEVCWKQLRDKDLAYRLHKLVEYKRNCKLLGNAFSESLYFKYLFRVLSEVEDIDLFMEFYDKYVPNTYTPEPSVTQAVVQAVHFAGAYKYLPRMCSDILLFEQSERGNIREVLFEAAACTKNEDEIQKSLVDMVWNVLENLKNRSQNRRLNFDWTTVMLGNVLKTFINGNDLDKASHIIKKLKEEEHLILGNFPDKSLLLEYCQLCLEHNNYDKIIGCVKYAMNGIHSEFREDLISFTEQLFEEKKIDQTQKDTLMSQVGTSAFDSVEDSSSSESSSSDSSSSDSSSSDSSSSESDEDDSEEITENPDTNNEDVKPKPQS